MKKRNLALSMLLIATICVCTPMLLACEEEIIPREVELELINPNTSEVLIGDERIDLPAERTYVEVRIKDKETGAYLTDADLPENTVKGSYDVGFEVNETGSPIFTSNHWPLNSELSSVYDYYRASIYFDCKPRSLRIQNLKESIRWLVTQY